VGRRFKKSRLGEEGAGGKKNTMVGIKLLDKKAREEGKRGGVKQSKGRP